MTNHYKSYEGKHTNCNSHPKDKSKDSCCPHIENKNIGNPRIIINNDSNSKCGKDKYKKECKKKFKKRCDCPINRTTSNSFNRFSLACGSSLKIFESDEPVEIDMLVELEERIFNEDLCNLKVNVLLENGSTLEFDLPNPNLTTTSSEDNTISFYSKNVREVTLECESVQGIGCTGFWSITLPLRGSEKDRKCECPVNTVISRNDFYSLECGGSLMIFESNDSVEMFMEVILDSVSSQNSCDLKVIVELENGNTLEFDIPNPNVTTIVNELNTISFYSKNIRKVTIECQDQLETGCRGFWNGSMILRGSSND